MSCPAWTPHPAWPVCLGNFTSLLSGISTEPQVQLQHCQRFSLAGALGWKWGLDRVGLCPTAGIGTPLEFSSWLDLQEDQDQALNLAEA